MYTIFEILEQGHIVGFNKDLNIIVQWNGGKTFNFYRTQDGANFESFHTTSSWESCKNHLHASLKAGMYLKDLEEQHSAARGVL